MSAELLARERISNFIRNKKFYNQTREFQKILKKTLVKNFTLRQFVNRFR